MYSSFTAARQMGHSSFGTPCVLQVKFSLQEIRMREQGLTSPFKIINSLVTRTHFISQSDNVCGLSFKCKCTIFIRGMAAIREKNCC